MKNSNDTIGNRTLDLPVYSAALQLTVPPRALSTDDRHKNMEQQQVEMEVLGKKTIQVRSTIFWVFTQRRMVVSYRSLGDQVVPKRR
jgi:hypothetical protein